MDTNTLIFFVVGGGVVLLVLWAAIKGIGERLMLSRTANASGYVDLHDGDRALDAALSAMNPGWRAINVQQRTVGDWHAYLFQLYVHYERQEDIIMTEAYGAVLSPRLDVPHFKLSPRVQGHGIFGDISNDVVSKLRKLPRIAVPHHPPFEQRYTLHGADETAVRHLLSEGRMDVLAQNTTPLLTVEGQGNAIIYQSALNLDETRYSNVEKARLFIAVAEMLEELFQ